MNDGPFRIGELARRTGISVRTLHHYDEIGLLSPSQRTPAGHRLYTAADLARLQQVLSLRQLGFSLAESAACLRRPEMSVGRVLTLHLERLDEEIRLRERLRARLQAIAAHLRKAEDVSAEHFLETIEVTKMFDKYLSAEQRAELEERGRQLGAERIREVEAEWPQLIAAVRGEMERGTPPDDPRVRELARRWMALVQEFSGGNVAIEKSVARMYREERGMSERYGFDAAILDYVQQAAAATRPIS